MLKFYIKLLGTKYLQTMRWIWFIPCMKIYIGLKLYAVLSPSFTWHQSWILARLHEDWDWSNIYIVPSQPPTWAQGSGHGLRSFMLKFYIKLVGTKYLQTMRWIWFIPCMKIYIGLKLYAVLSPSFTWHQSWILARLHEDWDWSNIYIVPSQPPTWAQGSGHGLRSFMLKFYIKLLGTKYLQTMPWIWFIPCMKIYIVLKLYAVLSPSFTWHQSWIFSPPARSTRKAIVATPIVRVRVRVYVRVPVTLIYLLYVQVCFF